MGRDMSLEQLYCSDSQRRISYKSNPLLECPEIRKASRPSRQCQWLSKSQKGRESPGINLGVKHVWSGLGDNAKKWIFESSWFPLKWMLNWSSQWSTSIYGSAHDLRHTASWQCAIVPDVWQRILKRGVSPNNPRWPPGLHVAFGKNKEYFKMRVWSFGIFSSKSN